MSLVRRCAAVGAIVAAWCALGIGVPATFTARTAADEPEYLLTAISLGEDHNLDVSDERVGRRYRPFHEPYLPVQSLRADDGRRVSPHDPLLPAVLAVPVALGGWIAAKATLVLLAGGLAASTLWVAVRRFGVGAGTATVTVLAFSCAPPLAVYATQVYPELPAALAVIVAIGCLTGPLRRAGVAGTLAAVVTLPWLALKYAPVAAVLATALGLRLWRRAEPGDRARLAGGVVVLAVAGALYLGAHEAWYGGVSAYAAGDHFVGGELTAAGTDVDLLGRAGRLAGLLVDRGFGLGVWQPLFFVVPVALGAIARRRPPGVALLGAVLGAGWLTATFVALTMHGFWWPGRQVVVVAPVLVLAVAWWVGEGAARVRAAAIVSGLGVLAFAWLVAEGWADRVTWVFGFEGTANPFVRVLRLVLPDLRRAGVIDAVLGGLWVVGLGTAAIAGWRRAVAPRGVEHGNESLLGFPNTLIEQTEGARP